MKTRENGRSSAGISEIQLSNCDFQIISEIAKRDYGLNLEESKRPLVKSRLSKRIRDLNLQDFSEYCHLVKARDSKERDNFIASLTTNVTHFYREKHHFDMLERVILPSLFQNAREGKPVRIWSAGCSSGQEPFSIAGSVLKALPDAGRLNVKITATDLDPTVLSRAQKGIFKIEDCRFPTYEYEKRIFRDRKSNSETMEVRSEIRNLVTFSRLNLIENWPNDSRQDVIFCRNVAIYFDKETQQNLWKRFVDHLHPQGHLFIGHSERVTGNSLNSLTSVGITSYQKKHGPQNPNTDMSKGSNSCR